MERVYIAIGSNLNNPLQQVQSAIKELHQLPNTKPVTVSSFYHSKPMGPQGQPDYLNAVIALDTELCPQPCLNIPNRLKQCMVEHVKLIVGAQERLIWILCYMANKLFRQHI